MKKFNNYYPLVLFVGIIVFIFTSVCLNMFNEKAININLETTQLNLSKGDYYLFLDDKTNLVVQEEVNNELHSSYSPATGITYLTIISLKNANTDIQLDADLSDQIEIENFGYLYSSFSIKQDDYFTLTVTNISPDDSVYSPNFTLISVNPHIYNTTLFIKNYILLISVVTFLGLHGLSISKRK